MLRLLPKSLKQFQIFAILAVSSVVAPQLGVCQENSQEVIKPSLQLINPQAKDQDDICIWRNHEHPDQSLMITSDKTAGFVFVYDLHGKLLQSVAVAKPGNIDIRQDVRLGDQTIDLVVVNQRKGFQLVPFRVDPQARKLIRIDAEPLITGPNYGGCLYHDRANQKVYFFCTSELGNVEQHELMPAGQGNIVNRKVREFQIGKCEGAVADDSQHVVFISDETTGVWKIGANPEDGTTPELIAPVGKHGMTGDVEGLALLTSAAPSGLLVVSDQGADHYLAFQREAPHKFVGEFRIAGAAQTDGIEIVSEGLGSPFPNGAFFCHTDLDSKPVLVTRWETILSALESSKAE